MTYLFSSTSHLISEHRLLKFAPGPKKAPNAPPPGPDKSPQGLAAKLEGLNPAGLDTNGAKELPTTIAAELKAMASTEQAQAEVRFTAAVSAAVLQEFQHELGEINKRTPPPDIMTAATEAAQKVMQDFSGIATISVDASGAPNISVDVNASAPKLRSAPTNKGEELTQTMEDAQAEFEAAGKEQPPNMLKQFAAAMKGLGAAFQFIKGSFDGSNEKAPGTGPNAAPGAPGSNKPGSAPNKSAIRLKLRTELKTVQAPNLLTLKEVKLGDDTKPASEKGKLKASIDALPPLETAVQNSKTKIANLESQKAKFKDPVRVDAIQVQIDAEQVLLTAAETALKAAQETKTKAEKSVTELEAEIKELKEMQDGLDKSAKNVEAVLHKMGETIGLFKNEYAQKLSATLKGITLWKNVLTLDLELLNPAVTLASIKTNAAILLHGKVVGAPALSDEDVGFTGAAGVLVPEKLEAFGKRVEVALQAKIGPRKQEIAKEKQENMDKTLENIKNKQKTDGSPDSLSDEERTGILKAANTKNTWVTSDKCEFIVLDDVIVKQYLDGSAAYAYTETTGDMRGFKNKTYNTVSKTFEDVPTKVDDTGATVPDTDNNKYNPVTRTWELK